jgi:hypothetical protein
MSASDWPPERQADLESRALAGTVALRPHFAAVHLDEVFDDGEAETEATV